MKPFKSAKGTVNWLLRFSLSGFFAYTGFSNVVSMNLDSADFYLSLLQFVFAVLLIVGGFLAKHNLTIISGIVLFFAGVYLVFSGWKSQLELFLFVNLLVASTALYFVSNGNRN